MDFIVGTFNSPDLYTLHFTPPSVNTTEDGSITCIRPSPAIGNHSWLALSPNKNILYATAWTNPPSIAAYSIKKSGREVQFLNAQRTRARSGYVCCSSTHVYSAGGPTGEVFSLLPDGSIGDLVQELDFLDASGNDGKTEDRPHGDFGGLRHGAHSVDLSPDGRSLYIADIGRNCIWTYSVNKTRDSLEPHLKLESKHISPRPNDGPRHTWPHPKGRVLYSLQEHTSIVDVFDVAEDGVTLKHTQGVKIIPASKDSKHYWADEVRLSSVAPGGSPKYMYASTRGLQADTRGYVAVFEIDEHGAIISEEAIDIWETPTSGGIANAIEPAHWRKEHEGNEYLAMTDSEEGWVFALCFDGEKITEVARLNLGKTDEGGIVQAATAVWL